MRASGIRLGEKFVFEDRGGVWEKVTPVSARCVFGSRDDYGSEIQIGPEAFVYVMFDKPKPERAVRVQSQAQASGGIRVIVRDAESDSTLAEYEDVSPAMVVAIAAADEMALTPSRRRKQRYVVMDTAVDIEESAVCVLVRGAGSIGGEDDDRYEDGRVAGRGARGAPVERGRDGRGNKGNVQPVSGVRQEAGAEGQDMGGVRGGGDSDAGGVPPVSDDVRLEGQAVSGEGNADGDGSGRKVDDHQDAKDVCEV